MKLIQEIVNVEKEFIELRHRLHKYPELSLEEFSTSKIVQEKLQEYGYSVSIVGGSGVVGQLKKGSGGKKIGIRADMDALPIHEEAEVEYKSTIPNKMHACGHDGHTTTLLLAARYLKDVPFNGTLNLIFQPAEESGGGAINMVNDGLFEKFPCDYIFAYHNMPGDEKKKFFVKPGGIMASSDEIFVKIIGKGGHGSAPDKSKDPTIAISQIIMTLQTIVSRNTDPQDSIVITVGGIICGSPDSYNIIQEEGSIYLNLRALNSKVRDETINRIKAVVSGISDTLEMKYEFRINGSVGVTENDKTAAELSKAAAIKIFGEENVETDFKSVMGSEDFSDMQKVCPGAYCFISNGNTAYLHNPKYVFNDELLSQGASYFSQLVIDYLK